MKINAFLHCQCAPNSWLVKLAETTEHCFRRHTKIGKPSSLPENRVVEDVLNFETIVKLYVTVEVSPL